MKKYLLMFFGLVLLLSLISISYAQAAPDKDRDGLPDSQDRCPDDFGPVRNNGCPVQQNNDPTQSVEDRDGDGNPDNADRCPNEGGPASNGGCPENTNPCPEGSAATGTTCTPVGEATPTASPVLAVLPEGLRCKLATLGASRVNVREIPDTSGEIVGQLDPSTIYTVYFHIVGNSPEDEWFLVDLGWVSGTVVRLGGNCRSIPTIRLPQPFIIHLGDLALVFVGDERYDPALVEFPTDQIPTGQIPTDQIPPFLMQTCDGSVRMSWIEQDFHFCDGSVMPTDQMPNAEDGSAFECDGSVRYFDEFMGIGDTSLEGILIGLLLPAVKMGDGSVMPIDQFLGDGSIIPCVVPDDSSNVIDHRYQLLLGMVGDEGSESAHGSGGDGGAGKVQFQDFHFIAFRGEGFAGILIGLLQENSAGDPFAAFALNWSVPPDPETDWINLNGILIGLNQGDIYVCPGEMVAGDGSVMPSTGFEEVGFNPQPDPPAECVGLNFGSEE